MKPNIPPTSGYLNRVRQICPTIRTSVNTRTDRSATGKQTAVCKLVTPSGQLMRINTQTKTATGDTEREALLAFLELHEGWLGPSERIAVANVLEYLRAPTMPTSTPEEKREAWKYDDLVTRGRQRRKHRKSYWDPIEKKRVNLYADTLKAHLDPTCTCKYCVR